MAWKILLFYLQLINLLAVPVSGLPPWRAVFDPRSEHVGIVKGELALGQVFCEYFCFLCRFSFYRLFHAQSIIWDYYSRSNGVAGVPSGLSQSNPRIVGFETPTAASEEYPLLGCDAVNSSRCSTTFSKNMQPPTSGKGKGVAIPVTGCERP
jgi:hypothetical protein